MAKILEVTLVGGIFGQPISDTIISINADNINDIKDDKAGNSVSIIYMNDKKTVHYVKETRNEVLDKLTYNKVIMEIKQIYGVFHNQSDEKPIGNTFLDEKGNIIKCINCKDGFAFIEWETGKIKCTKCNYEK